jgi:repressor LexA
MLGRYPVDPNLFNPRADTVAGERAVDNDLGILDGDWLVVHRTTEARGQIVVAWRG